MRKIFKYSLMFAAALTLSMGFASCGDDDDDNSTSVNPVTGTDNVIVQAGNYWKAARQDWEWSEAFLFGAAGDYAIDPHIDTWPFNKTQFDSYMSKYHPATNETDAEIIDEAIATGQNLTGFHAVEYLIYREGQSRSINDITDDEAYFAQSAAQDLYLNALKLVSAWGGNVTDDEQALLDEVEFESKDYGEEFKNAGQPGSSYSTVTLATRQIITGANTIIGEVRDSKIGAPHTGEDVNYIESPHAYNSIQDFYDNIMSCKHALYGGYTVSGTTPTATSLIGVCLQVSQLRAAAEDVQVKLEAALTAINNMKKPFVLNYLDASAGDAMEALDELETSLNELDTLIETYGLQLETQLKKVNEEYVDLTVKPTYRSLADNTKKMVETLNSITW